MNAIQTYTVLAFTGPNSKVLREATFDINEPWTGYVPIDKVIADPNQPRKYFDVEQMKELKGSLENFRQVTAAVVKIRPEDLAQNKGIFFLSDGERRLRNIKEAGIDRIWVIYDPLATEEGDGLSQLVANFCKADHTQGETAMAVKRLIEDGKYKIDIVAAIIGYSEFWTKQLYSVTKLHPDVFKLISPPTPEKERLLVSVALFLARIENPEAQIETWNSVKHLPTRQQTLQIRMLAGVQGRATARRGRVPAEDADLVKSAMKTVVKAMEHAHTLPDVLLTKVHGEKLLQVCQMIEDTQDKLAQLKRKLVELPKDISPQTAAREAAKAAREKARADDGHEVSTVIKPVKTAITVPPIKLPVRPTPRVSPPKESRKSTLNIRPSIPPAVSPHDLRRPNAVEPQHGTPVGPEELPPAEKLPSQEEIQRKIQEGAAQSASAWTQTPAKKGEDRFVPVSSARRVMTSDDVLRELAERRARAAQQPKKVVRQNGSGAKPTPEVWKPFKDDDFVSFDDLELERALKEKAGKTQS